MTRSRSGYTAAFSAALLVLMISCSSKPTSSANAALSETSTPTRADHSADSTAQRSKRSAAVNSPQKVTREPGQRTLTVLRSSSINAQLNGHDLTVHLNPRATNAEFRFKGKDVTGIPFTITTANPKMLFEPRSGLELQVFEGGRWISVARVK